MKSVEQQVEEHLKLLRKRWQIGISKFKERIESFKHAEIKPKTIRTALYGDITLRKEELLLIDSFYLQRLKGVSHMGFVNYVYPEARHSRFEHSLGVFWIIKKILESPTWQDVKREKDHIKRNHMNLKCAAILHDVGHGPFSHCTEYILKCLGIDNILRNPRGRKDKSKPHERRAKEMILDEDFQLGILNNRKYYLCEALENLEADPKIISDMIVGKKVKNLLTPLINGPIDADKLDYYQRDAYFTGVPTGNIDAEFLMRVLDYNEDVGLYFKEKAFSTIIQMLFNREFIFSIVSYHPVVRVAQSMFVVAIIMALSCLDADSQINIILHLEMMDDSDLWTILDIIASSTQIRNEKHNILQNLLNCLRSRELFKRMAMLSLDDCKELGFGSKKIKKEYMTSDAEFYIDYDLMPLSYLTSKNIQHIVNIQDDEVIIFEITPSPKSMKERKIKFNKDLKEIKISCKNDIKSIYDKLGNSRKALVGGYAHFQHLLNKAILLRPKERGKITKEKLSSLGKQFKNINPPFLNPEVQEGLAEKLRDLRKVILMK